MLSCVYGIQQFIYMHIKKTFYTAAYIVQFFGQGESVEPLLSPWLHHCPIWVLLFPSIYSNLLINYIPSVKVGAEI